MKDNHKLLKCSVQCIHEDLVDDRKRKLPPNEIICEVAELFKVLGDATRVKILTTLLTCEVCVCDLAAILDMSQSAISHQLRVLKQAGLVKYKRNGKIVYYCLADDHVETILNMGMEHVLE